MKKNSFGKIFFNEIILITAVVILLSGCKKNDSPTSSQSNTNSQSLTCKVDGNDWTPNAPNSPVVAGYISGNLTLAATVVKGTTGEQMTIMVINLNNTGTFNLGYVVGNSYASFTRTASTSSETFMTDNSNTGTIQITKLDKTAKNITGTFTFKAKSMTGSNIVNITNGSFNVNYQ